MTIPSSGGSVGSQFVTISTSSYPTCNTSVVDLVPASAKVVEGQCYGRVRYYCSTPPPATVVSPTASYLKYSTFQDNACEFPSWYSSYNETVGCYQHGSTASFERTQCTDSATVTMTTYFNTCPNPNPTWCSTPFIQDTQFKIGVCTRSPSDATQDLIVDACTSGATIQTFNVLGDMVALFIACFIV
jgi:hypothetical protein